MSDTNPEFYKELRNRYLPKQLKVIFILESPPTNGGYFYDESGKPSELLFRSMISALLNIKPSTKKEGLQKFADAGFIIINPIYIPVDKLPDKEADNLILKNYPNFIDDLNQIVRGKKIDLILIKKNICALLENRLANDGFNVLNHGLSLPFPMHYYFEDFRKKLNSLIVQNK